ncbi:hypothetical protein NPIL_435441, partial [Nephila pilipes]
YKTRGLTIVDKKLHWTSGVDYLFPNA